jgi:predicted transcriptional regulator
MAKPGISPRNISHSGHSALTRRERQIMDILYRRGRATAGEVMEELSGDPNYSTVRTQLRVLEEKGHVHHEEHGLRYVYTPAVPRSSARKSALRHLVDTFFDGSAEGAVAAILGGEGTKLSDEQLDRIADLVKQSKAGKAERAGGAGGAGKAGKDGRE